MDSSVESGGINIFASFLHTHLKGTACLTATTLLIDWLTDCLLASLPTCLLACLPACLLACLPACLLASLLAFLLDCSLACSLASLLFSLPDCLTDWLIDGWLIDWLIDWVHKKCRTFCISFLHKYFICTISKYIDTHTRAPLLCIKLSKFRLLQINELSYLALESVYINLC